MLIVGEGLKVGKRNVPDSKFLVVKLCMMVNRSLL